MTKKKTIALFRKLFVKSARTRRNWMDMIRSLEDDGDLTANQAQYRRLQWDLGGSKDIK